jgi:Na+/proline symporter
MNALERIAIAGSGVLIGLIMMGAAYDKPQWYFMTLGVLGLVVFFAGPLFALLFKRGKSNDAGQDA